MNINLSDSAQQALVKNSINSLTLTEKKEIIKQIKAYPITAVVDGRGLACPMPLLKTKVALRGMQQHQSVYILATDPNSRADLNAFCNQSGLSIILSTQSTPPSKDTETTIYSAQSGLKKLDTIFHVIITKMNGN